jgi:hypothetical protein
VVEDLNRRIDREYARPQVGPPLRVKRVNLDNAVREWQAARAALAPPAPPAVAPTPPRGRRRWFRAADRR